MSECHYPSVFVTVGTTQFEELIDHLNTPQTALILHDLGCKKLCVQFGTGKSVEFTHHFDGINTRSYSTKTSIYDDIESADLVISHAGAGSIIETLKAGKPMVVVINEQLMNNHQTELADRMFNDGHGLRCVPQDLAATLKALPNKRLIPYEKGNVMNFINELNRLMGFE